MTEALIINCDTNKCIKLLGSKSMIDLIDSYKIIDQQIQALKSIYKNIKITIVAGYNYECIEKYVSKYKNVYIMKNIDYKNNNEAYGIKIFLDQNKQYPDSLLVISGTVLLKKHSIKINKRKSYTTTIYLLRGQKNNFSLGCAKHNRPDYIFYDLEYPWAECILLSKKDIKIIKDIIDNKQINIKNMFIFELLNKFLDKHTVHTEYINKNNIIKINNISDLKKAKNFI